MKFKKYVSAMLAACMLFTAVPVYADQSNLPTNTISDPQTAGEYLGELIAFLQDNYVGKKLTTQDLYYAAAKGMFSPLDQFSEYLTADEMTSLQNSVNGEFEGIGIQYEAEVNGDFMIGDVIPESPAEKAGVLKGDVLVKVSGTAVKGLSADKISQLVLKSPSTCVLVVSRNGQNKTFSIKKGKVQLKTVESGSLMNYLPQAKTNTNLGYIHISQIGDKTGDETKAAISKLQKMKITGVVIDLRDNPGGLKNVIEDISSMFVPKGVVYSTIDNYGSTTSYSSDLTTPPFKKIVILVNKNTASAAELFSSAMQDAKAATIIGQTSYGKGIIQAFEPLNTGDVVKYTSMEYLRRNGGKLNHIGVKPDIALERPNFVGTEIFEYNNDGTGTGIVNLKKVLNFIGYKKVDPKNPKYDAAAVDAVKDIQKKANLNVTGVFDVQTVTAINVAYSHFSKEHDQELAKALEVLTH